MLFFALAPNILANKADTHTQTHLLYWPGQSILPDNGRVHLYNAYTISTVITSASGSIFSTYKLSDSWFIQFIHSMNMSYLQTGVTTQSAPN